MRVGIRIRGSLQVGQFLSLYSSNLVLGSRAALIGTNNDNYSSSNTSSNGGSGSGATPLKQPRPPPIPQLFDRSPYEDANYATLYDCVAERFVPYSSSTFTCTEETTENAGSCSPTSEVHDQSAATIVAAQVDAECSRIELRKCGAAVSISEGTFERTTMVFLAVSDDLNVGFLSL